MSMSYFGMMRGFFVISGLGMLGRLTMVLCGMLVMIRRDLVVFMDVVAVHCHLPVSSHVGSEASLRSMKFLRRSDGGKANGPGVPYQADRLCAGGESFPRVKS
jgi:hypothetical protein